MWPFSIRVEVESPSYLSLMPDYSRHDPRQEAYWEGYRQWHSQLETMIKNKKALVENQEKGKA